MELELAYLENEQAMALSRGVIVPHLLLLVALGWLMFPYAPPWTSVLWALGFALYLAVRVHLNAQYAQRSVAERKVHVPHWRRVAVVNAFVFGCLAGIAALLAFPDSPLEVQLLWTLILTMVVAAAPRLVTFSQFIALASPPLIFLCIAWLNWGDELGSSIAPALMMLAVPFLLLAQHFHRDQRKAFELQIRHEQLTADLTRQNTLLESLARKRNLLLATSSHDLRQPVHALGLIMETLQRPVEPRTLRRRLATANQCVNSLSEMLNNLLDFARIDNGNFPVTQRIVALQELLDESQRTFAPIARHKELALRVINTPVAVRTDPLLTRRMLFNLVSNALKFTDKGTIEIVATVQSGQVVLHVEDSGVGIAPNRLEAIFEDYVTSDSKLTRFDMGIGLGLPIVRRCATLLDQQVTVISEPGKGSRFSIHMGEAASLDNAVPRVVVNAATLRGVVAIVENDPVILDGLIEMLRDWGCETAGGSSPEQVLRLLKERQLTPSLILSDLHLGDTGTGFEAIELLRRNAGGTHVPAVVLTGDISPVHQERATAENVRLEHKPLRPARLREVLAGMLATA